MSTHMVTVHGQHLFQQGFAEPSSTVTICLKAALSWEVLNFFLNLALMDFLCGFVWPTLC